jgi:hypothetical protein
MIDRLDLLRAGNRSYGGWLYPLGRFDSASPILLDPCPSCASLMRLTQIGASGRRLVPDSVTSVDSDSCRLRSPNLLAMKRRDPRIHLELGRNLVVD